MEKKTILTLDQVKEIEKTYRKKAAELTALL